MKNSDKQTALDAAEAIRRQPAPPPRGGRRGFWDLVRWLIRAFAAVSCIAVAAMIVATCADIVLRLLGHPIPGVYDIMSMLGAIAVGCALPLTTALKGHVAIEVFYLRMGRRGRVAVDTFIRALMIATLFVATCECVGYGVRLMRSGEVCPTLPVPYFWIAWILAAALATTALTTLYHLTHPGKEMMRR